MVLDRRLYDSLTLGEKLAKQTESGSDVVFTMASARVVRGKIWSASHEVVTLGDRSETKIPTGFLSPNWIVSVLLPLGISNSDPVELENTSLLGCLDSTIPPGTQIALRCAAIDKSEHLRFRAVAEDHLICSTADGGDLYIVSQMIAEVTII